MLKIRPKQFSAFDDQAEDGFITKLCDYARADLTVWVKYESDEILRERVRSGIARARSHGFEWQSSIGKFVALMIRFAPNFDQHPSARAILARKKEDGEQRADKLMTGIPAEDWMSIEDSYDPSAWTDFATGRVL